MKFWELMAVCQEEPELLARLADRPEWGQYLDWWRREDSLINNQERDKLDRELPDELCRHILAPSSARYRISNGHLQRVPANSAEPTYSAVEIYDRYGGSVLEEVKEKGSARVAPPR
jgi:hypothetical protein